MLFTSFGNFVRTIGKHSCVRYTYDAFLNLLSPPYCCACWQLLVERTALCRDCSKQIKPVVSVDVPLTPTYHMRVFAVSNYQEPLKRLIVSKAWSDSISAYQLGQLIWEHTPVCNLSFDVIVPVPLHWTRYAWRGYNQADEIARVIGRRSGKPVRRLVRRSRSTPFQSSIAPSERTKNVRDVFSLSCCCLKTYQGKHILLVDDLMTTSATLTHVGKQLMRAKPASITAVVACRVVV